MTFKAAVLQAPNSIKIENREAKKLKANEVRIRVLAAGVCGTDLALHSGNYPVPLPLVLGHEWVGVVEEVANESDRHFVGKTIVADINNTCRSYRKSESDFCEACRRGFETHCMTRTVTGIINYDGAFAEQCVVPAGNVHVLPDDFPFEQAVLIEPLAAALRTFEVLKIEGTEMILVLGCGRLGLLIAIVAKQLGLDVLVTARSCRNLEIAEKFGLNILQTTDESELIKVAKQKTKGLGMDIVVEATASPAGLPLALQIVRPLGTVCLKSTPGTSVENFPLTQFVVDEVQISSSRCGNFAHAIDFHQKNNLDLSPILRHSFPLGEIERALECAMSEAGKTVLRVS